MRDVASTVKPWRIGANFLAGKQDEEQRQFRNALADRDMEMREQTFSAQQQRANREQDQWDRIDAVRQNPNSTPDDYYRAGDTATGNALATRDRQRHLDDAGVLYRAAQQVELAADPLGQAQSLMGSREIADVFARHGIDASSWEMADPEQVRLGARQLRERIAPFLEKQPTSEELVQTRGPDGKPVFTPRSRAAGMTPYEKPNEAPSSYQEYLRSRKDPAYRQFLEERRRKGMSFTSNPDGTMTVDIGGEGGGIGPGELSKPLVNKLQETIVNSQDRLDRLDSTMRQFNPEFFRAKGMANVWGARLKDFAGMNVPASQRKFLQDYAGFQASIKNDLSQYLHELSGAAISEGEYARLSKAGPTGDELSPAEFQSKASATVKNLMRATMRANWALKNGIGVQSADQLARVMPLEGIDQVFEQRANDLWQQMGGTPESRAQAIQQAKQEFGMVR